jgi:DinB family protein
VIDFEPLRRREVSLQDLARDLSRDDLANLTREMCMLQLSLIADAEDADVVLVPDDPEANDKFAARPEDVGLSWTLGHVVVHTTASSEESAALALVLARGLPVEGRSRYEVPWEEARTVSFLRRRIDESLRMRLSMLAAWPDEPHLDNFYSPYEGRPPMNALGRFLGGLAHDDSHVGQMRNIMVQARQIRAASR